VSASASASSSLPAGAAPRPVFTLKGDGRYQGRRLKIDFASAGVLPWVADEEPAIAVPLTVQARLGRASLSFQGSAVDALGLSGLKGRFSVDGPSLAAVGRPIGLTLPTTTAFHTEGDLDKWGETWRVAVRSATVGLSRLDGDFVYQGARSPPLLTGRLGGTRLMLADLGPAIGTTPLEPAAEAASASAPAAKPAKPLKARSNRQGKLLPARPFDLASLRAMNADVHIDINEADLNTKLLQPLRPLRGQLTLADGVLTLGALDARTAGGRMTGGLKLDGRGNTALWNADLRWDGIRLEQWIRQAREDGAPPYVSGRLGGRAVVEGQGISTAAILATMKGTVSTELRDGKVSHLLVEKAGIDLAEGLGLMIKGDDTLPVSCAVADLVAESGVLRPRVMVLDTTDSTIWVDGSLSLASEALDLRAVVSPKDFSPLTLRTPLRVAGSFSQPVVSLDKGPVAARLAGAVALALVNPLAALIPFIDIGSAGAAERGSEGCRSLVQRGMKSAAPAVPGKTAPATTSKARP
jgi:AsmA family protein